MALRNAYSDLFYHEESEERLELSSCFVVINNKFAQVKYH